MLRWNVLFSEGSRPNISEKNSTLFRTAVPFRVPGTNCLEYEWFCPPNGTVAPKALIKPFRTAAPIVGVKYSETEWFAPRTGLLS